MKNYKIFHYWLLSNHIYSNEKEICHTEKIIQDHLSRFCVDLPGLFKEKNPSVILTITVALVESRSTFSEISLIEYNQSINYLMAYADYLRLRQIIGQRVAGYDNREDGRILGYFLSRFDETGKILLGFDTLKETFDELGILLNVKPMFIKNYRDSFDPYFPNPRTGWLGRSLIPAMQSIFDRYENETDSYVLMTVESILDKYRNKRYLKD